MTTPSRTRSPGRAPSRLTATTGTLARVYAAVIVGLRYPIVAGWIVAVAAAMHYLPQLAQSSGEASLVPSNAPAVRAEVTAAQTFGAPLDAQAAVVQRAAGGLSPAALDHAGRAALACAATAYLIAVRIVAW